MEYDRFRIVVGSQSELGEVRVLVADSQDRLLKLIKLLSSGSVQEKLETEAFFKVVEVVTKQHEAETNLAIKVLEATNREKLRSRLGLFLMSALAFTFLLLFLHSGGYINLPAASVEIINWGMRTAVFGIFALFASYVFGGTAPPK